MTRLLPTLFGYSWPRTATVLGALASTMVLAAAAFRFLSRDAVEQAGYCAVPAAEGAEVFCAMGVGLARIADALGVGAILVGGGVFWAVFQGWRHGKRTRDAFGGRD